MRLQCILSTQSRFMAASSLALLSPHLIATFESTTSLPSSHWVLFCKITTPSPLDPISSYVDYVDSESRFFDLISHLPLALHLTCLNFDRVNKGAPASDQLLAYSSYKFTFFSLEISSSPHHPLLPLSRSATKQDTVLGVPPLYFT